MISSVDGHTTLIRAGETGLRHSPSTSKSSCTFTSSPSVVVPPGRARSNYVLAERIHVGRRWLRCRGLRCEASMQLEHAAYLRAVRYRRPVGIGVDIRQPTQQLFEG